jgi:hypothetical protein
MSGHAAYALVLLKDRGQFAKQKHYPSGEHLPPSQGESPFPLDCYLSWMSRFSPVPLFPRHSPAPGLARDFSPDAHHHGSLPQQLGLV